MPIHKDIHAYNAAQPDPATCNTLAAAIRPDGDLEVGSGRGGRPRG